jgi:hypothetical protein
MSEVNEALARYDEWLERLRKSAPVEAARVKRLQRRARTLWQRVTRSLIGLAAVILGAVAWGGLIAPLDFWGLVITLLLMVGVVIFFATFPRERDPVVATLKTADLGALPAQVEDWLDSRRMALPPPSRRELDRIMVLIDGLAPDLGKLDPLDPRGLEVRELIGNHLPGLVERFTEVPARVRGQPETRAKFDEGLALIRGELETLGADLAEDRLKALRIEGRAIEGRLRRDGATEDG